MHTTQLHIDNTRTTLAATLFTPNTDNGNAIIIAPATGIKRRFYAAFATYLAEQGYHVLTFDNEGIGESGQGDTLTPATSLITWGRYDITAAIETMTKHLPTHRLHLIGHSAGGQLFGLSPQHDKLVSVLNVGSSSGSLKNMRPAYRIKAKFFLNGVLPITAKFTGKGRSDWIGMGEPLPRDVALQWRDWCNASSYIQSAFGREVQTHYYDKVNLPALWLNAPDDDIATNANVHEMIAVFPNMQARTRTLIPQDFGLSEIGHMKFFSRKSQVLWGIATEWLV
ncbi:MAG: alpha/beta fold hydrolase [Moraxella sp.]|nr:alpha/beta fold hydrolase [Moraxella sp.]